MKKTKFVLLSCITAFSIAISSITVNASAVELTTNTGVNLNQPAVILEDRLEEIKNDNSMSEDDKQRHIEKVEYMISLRDISNVTQESYTHSKYSKVLNVPYFKQENDSYCGPATAQQTYKYYKGYSPSQETLAKEGGFYIGGETISTQSLLDYLNKKLGTTYEQFGKGSTNYNGSVRLICESIDKNCPPILRVKVPSEYSGNRDLGISGDTSKWPYAVSGHYLNVSGYTKYGEMYQMTDPWLEWKYSGSAASTGTFLVNSDTTYQVIREVCV